MNLSENATESSACRVRPAVGEDLETIVEFNCALAQESEGLTLDRDVVVHGVRAVLEDPHRGRYLVAEIDDRPVGQAQITYEWTDWRNGWFWWLQSVYVRPQCRCRGVFRSLYMHIVRAAQERGDVRGLRLYVEQANAPAIDTYTRVGMGRTSYLLYERNWSETLGRE